MFRIYRRALTEPISRWPQHGKVYGRVGTTELRLCLLTHVHNRTDAVATLHHLEGVVYLAQRLAVRDELVDLELAVEVVADQARQLRAALDAAEGASAPDTAGYQLEC